MYVFKVPACHFSVFCLLRQTQVFCGFVVIERMPLTSSEITSSNPITIYSRFISCWKSLSVLLIVVSFLRNSIWFPPKGKVDKMGGGGDILKCIYSTVYTLTKTLKCQIFLHQHYSVNHNSGSEKDSVAISGHAEHMQCDCLALNLIYIIFPHSKIFQFTTQISI